MRPHASHDSPRPPWQVNTISRSQLIDLAESYPRAKATLKKAALYMLVRAGILTYYRRHIKKSESPLGNNKVRIRVRVEGLCEDTATVDESLLAKRTLSDGRFASSHTHQHPIAPHSWRRWCSISLPTPR